MEIDKEFLDNWKSSYAKMIDDSYKVILDHLSDNVQIFMKDNPPRQSKLEKFNRRNV